MIFQGLIGNKFIDQHSLATSNAITFERDKMAMMDSADNLNLRLELSLALPASRFQALDGNHGSIGQHTLVDVPEPALAQHVGFGEPVCGGGELFVCEGVLVEPQSHSRRRRWQGCVVWSWEVWAGIAAVCERQRRWWLGVPAPPGAIIHCARRWAQPNRMVSSCRTTVLPVLLLWIAVVIVVTPCTDIYTYYPYM